MIHGVADIGLQELLAFHKERLDQEMRLWPGMLKWSGR
jgi:hypothetical protein